MKLFAALAAPLAVVGILVYGLYQKTDILSCFARGAKKGLHTAASMLAPLVLFFAVLGMFEASGGLDVLCHFLAPAAELFGVPREVIPLALLRPLSGSGAMTIFQQILSEYGPDSLAGRTASVIQSASETTFYTLAVYFGAVGISRQRYAAFCSLAGDLTVILSAGWLVRKLF